MKHMKQIVMGLMLIGLAVAGYMAYQRYYAPQADEVKVQFLNFGGNYEDGDDFHHHNSSYKSGYEAGFEAGQNS